LGMVSTNGFFTSAITVSLAKFFLYDEIHHAPFLVKIAPMLVGVIAIALAFVFYIKKPQFPNLLAKRFPRLYNLSYNKWYFDEFYENTLVSPTKKLGNFLWRIVDIKIVDGIPNGAVSICRLASRGVSKIQSGFVYHYATWMVFGLVIIGLIFIDFAIPLISKGDTLYSLIKTSFFSLFSLKF